MLRNKTMTITLSEIVNSFIGSTVCVTSAMTPETEKKF